jgi:phosphate transport system substrate-binding protein
MRRLARSVVLLLVVAQVACGGVGAPTADPLAGDYLAATAESAVPVAQRLTSAFAARHPGMRWTVRDVGSAAAIELVVGGEADVAFLSRELTVEDLRRGQAIGLGYSGQVLIVNRANPVTDLSRDQLRGIFDGTIRDWSEVGGTPGPILVLLRPASSPTRAALEPVLRAPGTAYRTDAVMTPDAASMLNAVMASGRAIGMISAPHLAGLPDAPRAIAVGGLVPTKANVADGSYPFRRPISLLVRANSSLLRAGAAAFRDFVHGEEGQRILRELF